MSWKQKLRKLFVCGALLAGLLYGSPMKPEEIEELMYASHKQKQVQVVKDEEGEP